MSIVIFEEGVLNVSRTKRPYKIQILDDNKRLRCHFYFLHLVGSLLNGELHCGKDLPRIINIRNKMWELWSVSRWQDAIPIVSINKKSRIKYLVFSASSIELVPLFKYLASIPVFSKKEKFDVVKRNFSYLQLHNLLYYPGVFETLELLLKLPRGIFNKLQRGKFHISECDIYPTIFYSNSTRPLYINDLYLRVFILIPEFIIRLIRRKDWPSKELRESFIDWLQLPDDRVLEVVL